MFKTFSELMTMTLDEIVNYVKQIEADTVEYCEWCGNELGDALEAKGISDDEFAKAFQS